MYVPVPLGGLERVEVVHTARSRILSLALILQCPVALPGCHQFITLYIFYGGSSLRGVTGTVQAVDYRTTRTQYENRV